MRRMAGVLSTVAVVVLATGMAAQDRPDFSGAWAASAQNAGRGRGGGPSGTMGSGWGSSITIAQNAKRLTVERVFFVRGDLQPALKFHYSLNGSESTNTVLMGRGMQEQVSTTAWQGDTLIIITVRTGPVDENGQATTSEVTQRLSLQRSSSLVRPPSLVVETTIGGVLGGPSSTTRTVYTRR